MWRVRVLVCEDSRIFSELLQVTLEDWGHEVQCVESARECRAALAKGEWDALILDLELREEDGLGVLPAAKQLGVPVLVLTAHTEGVTIRLLKTKGVRWLIGKWSSGLDDLRRALVSVAADIPYLGTDVTRSLAESEDWGRLLTPRDVELLGLLADGFDDEEIAARWPRAVSINAVQVRARSVAEKVGMPGAGRAKLGRWAAREGFGSLVRSGAMV